jgi:hypothetical protein
MQIIVFKEKIIQKLNIMLSKDARYYKDITQTYTCKLYRNGQYIYNNRNLNVFNQHLGNKETN